MQLKNKTKDGYRLKKMNDNTYKLRRSVINIIYELNNFLKANKCKRLPRVEVRIIEEHNCKRKIGGYAYIGRNIIHIPEQSVGLSYEKLLRIVIHEVLHGLGFHHDDKCHIMHPGWPTLVYDNLTREKLLNTFLGYIDR